MKGPRGKGVPLTWAGPCTGPRAAVWRGLCPGRKTLAGTPGLLPQDASRDLTAQRHSQTGQRTCLGRQKDRSRLPFPTLGDLPDPEIEPVSLTSPVLAGGVFTNRATMVFSVVTYGCESWTIKKAECRRMHMDFQGQGIT